jgi:hypothetical protein
VPAPTSTVLPSAAAPAVSPSPVALAAAPEPVDEPDGAAGRHARPEQAAPEAVGRAAARRAAEREPVGRREAGRRPASRGSAPVVRSAPDPALLEGIELPQGQATPEQAEAIADLMLSRLSIEESAQQLPSPDDFPGGRWAAAGAGLVAVLLVLLLVYAVVGAIVD